MTQSETMDRRVWVTLGIMAAGLPIWGQPAPSEQVSARDEFFDVFNEHPRLFLDAQRLRRLRRERERRTMRWLQFETLMAGRAPMAEPGFAGALFYQASGDKEIGRRALQWALSSEAKDLRQLALVFDWCQPILSEADSRALQVKLQAGFHAKEKSTSLAAIRDRTLAALALAGHDPWNSKPFFEWLVKQWWRVEITPQLKAGRSVISRDESLPLMELMHAVRDNLQIDLREGVGSWFKELPIYHLLTYYPATFPGAENEFRIPVSKTIVEPDTRRALESRVAELAMIAYETNAPETQVIQGWLMHDRFLLRGTLGITHEFLWANPYQPGLSYYHVPLIHHDALFGRLFVRSSWEDDATWLGYWDGQLQMFKDGQPQKLKLDTSQGPISFPDLLILTGGYARKCRIELTEEQELFILGLKPGARYDIEMEDEEIFEVQADKGGMVHLKPPRKKPLDFRMHEAGAGLS